MFGLRRLPRKTSPVPPSAEVPEGQVVWAIGDIHGRMDLLRALITAIYADFMDKPASRRTIVFLGDYVDRGPASREVLEGLAHLSQAQDIEMIFLAGNHEEAMLAFLGDPAQGARWCEFGGRETLRSYGVDPPQDGEAAEAWEKTAHDLAFTMPRPHRDFLEKLRPSVQIGDYFFAHAGARPGVPLEEQTDHDLKWIRQPFLDSRQGFDRVIVHGHTPADDYHSDGRRIGLDTGAYATGRLTAVRLEGASRQILQTQPVGGRIAVNRQRLQG